jgi:hypothetical protein
MLRQAVRWCRVAAAFCDDMRHIASTVDAKDLAWATAMARARAAADLQRGFEEGVCYERRMIRIRSSTSREAWWFDGYHFGDKRWHHDEVPTVKHPDSLLDALVDKICNMARWGGELTETTGDVWTVGQHSLLVVEIVNRLAGPVEVDGAQIFKIPQIGEIKLPMHMMSVLRRLAACHDLGEALGLGDPAGPLLEDESLAGLRVMARNHQLAAESLIDLPRDQQALHPLRQIVHYADMLARVHERDALWGDAMDYAPTYDDGAERLRVTRWLLRSRSTADLSWSLPLETKDKLIKCLGGF